MHHKVCQRLRFAMHTVFHLACVAGVWVVRDSLDCVLTAIKAVPTPPHFPEGAPAQEFQLLEIFLKARLHCTRLNRRRCRDVANTCRVANKHVKFQRGVTGDLWLLVLKFWEGIASDDAVLQEVRVCHAGGRDAKMVRELPQEDNYDLLPQQLHLIFGRSCRNCTGLCDAQRA
jgi:hypothetical protein